MQVAEYSDCVAADETLALPINPELSDERSQYVDGKVKEYLG